MSVNETVALMNLVIVSMLGFSAYTLSFLALIITIIKKNERKK